MSAVLRTWALVLALIAALLAPQMLMAAAVEGLRVVAVAPVQGAVLEPGEPGEPLLPLFKQSCGEGLVAVYGPRHGEPVVIVVYASRSSPGPVEECLRAAEPCLAAVGARPGPVAYVAVAGPAEGNVSARTALGEEGGRDLLALFAAAAALAACTAAALLALRRARRA